MTDILITQAKQQDAHRVARMLLDWIEVSEIPWPPAALPAVTEWVEDTILGGYVVIAEKSGRLLGTAGIRKTFLPWNPETPVFSDVFFFVPKTRGDDPERIARAARRVPGVANALMDALKMYCARRETPLVMAIICGADADKVDRWYQIKGGRYAGGTYVFGM